MSNSILNNIEEIKKLDSKNMLGSLQLLPKQVEEVWECAKKLKIPANYKRVKNIVVLGMGGSTLGAHIIKSVFFDELKAPLEIVNGYHIPAYVDKNSLVVVSSYSGTTEEPLFAMKEADKRKAKMAIITSDGDLAKIGLARKIPSLIFSTNNNPCGSPRMGLGYLIVGQMILFAKAGLIKLSAKDVNNIVVALSKYDVEFGTANLDNNLAKEMATNLFGKSVWFLGAQHLSGNAHAAANQTNENAKRFAGYFLIPELNHHLMEGMIYPDNNKNSLGFVLFESALYDVRLQKRFDITKKVLEKNEIKYWSYRANEKTKILQACEVLVFGSYVSYYGAMLQGIDPTAIPFVDFFKEQLKK
ncbi:MAG: SIS domain-containing protein [Candidatus Magasanikbacteria bacterium]|jgi:glucose/mannose-6-phosphate isomerase